MHRLALAFALSLCLAPAGRARCADTVRVACVGDSITYGAGIADRARDCYPAVLGRLLGAGFEVRNFGVSGATLLSKGDRPYRSLDAFREASELQPHVVVIQLGTNDSKPQNWRFADQYSSDLAAMIDHFRALESQPRVLVSTPVPVFEDRWGINDRVVRGEIVPAIWRVADAKGVEVVDLYRALSGARRHFPDGVHPNAAGSSILARAVFEGLRAEVAPRPNVVVFIADDMAWDDCGAYGHPSIRTPSIDRLAREGLRFDSAFLTISSCSPSRSSILTGRYPHSTGAGELHLPLPASQLMLTETLRDAGYWTASAGKWHLGKAAEAKLDRVWHGGGASGCENWLEALRARPKDRPFFLWLAAVDPHRDYSEGAIPEPHRAEDVVVPPFLPDTEATRRDLALYYDEVARFDSFVGRVLDELDAQGVAESTLVLLMSDNGRPFPRCKTTVYHDGVRTPFIVRWPARVRAASTTASVVSSVDIAPTITELAGAKVPSSFQGKSFAGVLRDPGFESRRHAFAEHNWHDYTAHERAVLTARLTYVWNAWTDLPGTPPADAVRSPTYVEMRRLRDAGELAPWQRDCFRTPRPAEQLFDARRDPHSIDDRVADPAYGSGLEELRAALAEWKRATGDEIPAERRPDGFHREEGTRLGR